MYMYLLEELPRSCSFEKLTQDVLLNWAPRTVAIQDDCMLYSSLHVSYLHPYSGKLALFYPPKTQAIFEA